MEVKKEETEEVMEVEVMVMGKMEVTNKPTMVMEDSDSYRVFCAVANALVMQKYSTK